MVERQVRNGQEAADTKAFRLVGWDSARGEDPRLLKRPSSCDEDLLSTRSLGSSLVQQQRMAAMTQGVDDRSNMTPHSLTAGETPLRKSLVTSVSTLKMRMACLFKVVLRASVPQPSAFQVAGLPSTSAGVVLPPCRSRIIPKSFTIVYGKSR